MLVDAPEPHRPVGAGRGEQPPFWMKCDTEHGAVVTVETPARLGLLLTRLRVVGVPEPDCSVAACGGESVPVRAERDRDHRTCVAVELAAELLGLVHVSQPHSAVIVCGGEHMPIRTEREAPEGLASAREPEQRLTRSHVPKSHRSLVLADAGVPDERRVVGGDAAARALPAGEVEVDHARRHGSVQPDENRVSGLRLIAEADDRLLSSCRRSTRPLRANRRRRAPAASTARSEGARSSAKVICSPLALRGVETCVPAGMSGWFGCAFERRNVSSVLAAVGGRSVTPSSSRNFT